MTIQITDEQGNKIASAFSDFKKMVEERNFEGTQTALTLLENEMRDAGIDVDFIEERTEEGSEKDR